MKGQSAMTIKEMEARTGMSRANIRYYEQEGLIAPQRDSNGYRNYQESDVQALERILLMRRLGVSLEDIRALQAGSLPLGEAMERQADKLGREQQEAAAAQALCRSIQTTGVPYGRLDARPFLQAPQPPPELPAMDAILPLRHPWRRHLARSLDLGLYSLLWYAFWELVLRRSSLQMGTAGQILHTLMAMVLMLALEPLLLWRFGATFGKWVFGLRLENDDGGRPDYWASLGRTFFVLQKGLCFQIPIASLVYQIKSYKRCKAGEPQPWDEGFRYTIRDTRAYRGLVYALSVLTLTGLMFLTTLGGRMPPTRGGLDVADFAQNYNALAAYYGENDGFRLNSQGAWEAWTIEGGPTPLRLKENPSLQYTVEDGVLTGVSLSFAMEDAYLSNVQDVMLLSALAFAGAQPEAGLFSPVRDQCIRQIQRGFYQGYQMWAGNVLISYHVEGDSGLGAEPLEGTGYFSMERCR